MKKTKTKNNSRKTLIIAIAIIAVLAIATAILYPYYLKQNNDVRNAYKNGKVIIKVNDELLGEYTLEQLIEIVPPVDFHAVYKPSGKLPLEKTYTGILFKDVLTSLNIDMADKTGAILKASDGMQQTYTKAEILENDNMYIAFKVEGEPFNVEKKANAYEEKYEDGGPLVVILAKDSTSQHRTKWLAEINII